MCREVIYAKIDTAIVYATLKTSDTVSVRREECEFVHVQDFLADCKDRYKMCNLVKNNLSEYQLHVMVSVILQVFTIFIYVGIKQSRLREAAVAS